MNDAFLRGRLFALLSSMYLCKPTSEVLANWRQMLKEEPLAGAEELSQSLAAIDLDSEQELEDILWDYTRLFMGPDRLPCPPLESVYTSPKRLMMQDAFVEVQQFYGRVGIEIASADVMPDHIGAELNFLSVLFDRMSTEPARFAEAGALAEEFIERHLGKWTPQFTEDMETAAATPFYAALAATTRAVIPAVRQHR